MSNSIIQTTIPQTLFLKLHERWEHPVMRVFFNRAEGCAYDVEQTVTAENAPCRKRECDYCQLISVGIVGWGNYEFTSENLKALEKEGVVSREQYVSWELDGNRYKTHVIVFLRVLDDDALLFTFSADFKADRRYKVDIQKRLSLTEIHQQTDALKLSLDTHKCVIEAAEADKYGMAEGGIAQRLKQIRLLLTIRDDVERKELREALSTFDHWVSRVSRLQDHAERMKYLGHIIASFSGEFDQALSQVEDAQAETERQAEAVRQAAEAERRAAQQAEAARRKAEQQAAARQRETERLQAVTQSDMAGPEMKTSLDERMKAKKAEKERQKAAEAHKPAEPTQRPSKPKPQTVGKGSEGLAAAAKQLGLVAAETPPPAETIVVETVEVAVATVESEPETAAGANGQA